MTLDRDPERSERVLDRLDGRHYGDDLDDDRPVPEDVAPLCDSCEEREAVESFDLGDDRTVDLCDDCTAILALARKLLDLFGVDGGGSDD